MFEILITGTSGFSGKIITQELIKLNFKIFILRGKNSLIETYKNHEKVKIITLDNIKKNDFFHGWAGQWTMLREHPWYRGKMFWHFLENSDFPTFFLFFSIHTRKGLILHQ